MKKVLLLIGGLSLLYFGYTKMKKPETDDAAALPGATALTLDQIASNYNGKIVIDKNGYYTVVQNGKFRAAGSADLVTFPEQVTLPIDLWALAAGTRPDLIASV